MPARADAGTAAAARSVAPRSSRPFPGASPSQQINRQIGGVESFTPVTTRILFEHFWVDLETIYTILVSIVSISALWQQRGTDYEISNRASPGITATDSQLVRCDGAAERGNPRRCVFCPRENVHAHPWPWSLRH